MNKNVPEIRFEGFSDEWKENILSDMTHNIGTGKSKFILNKMSNLFQYPILGSTSIIGYDSGYDYKGNFILTARVGANAGNLYRYSGKVKITDNTIFIQTKNLEFIYALLSDFDLKKLSFGTGQPLLKASELKNSKFYFTSVSEQTKIGNFFKELDERITIASQELDRLKETKQGFLQKMFPKDGETMPKIRFGGFDDEWENVKLEKIALITMGQSPNSVNYTSNPNDHILVQGNADIKNGKVVPRVWSTQITKTADVGDIILSVRAPVGDVGITEYNIVIGRGVAAVKANDFIHQTLLRMKYTGYWTRYVTGSTFESINSNNLKEALVITPHKEEQTAIGNFFKKLDDTIALQQKELELLKETKKGFLQKMFI
ncbi:restriction endonuclease subunit S [Vagococcus salmoninarum]|uniref:restriction endonuclease subunit S n=1 Tax=Vagococcus salmoninarum TaxID=2739 RepID=UPI0028D5A947|nr:restriction endonuclease subunit S [Vagococcus salmoninarum]